MVFFEIVNGKQVSPGMNKQQFEEYKDICRTVFGGVPLDITWTLNNLIFKQEAEKRMWLYTPRN